MLSNDGASVASAGSGVLIWLPASAAKWRFGLGGGGLRRDRFINVMAMNTGDGVAVPMARSNQHQGKAARERSALEPPLPPISARDLQPVCTNNGCRFNDGT
jgi:hypothetical protein